MISNLTHYWCHSCKTDLYQMLPQAVCGFCGSELIEEVEESSPHPSNFVPAELRSSQIPAIPLVQIPIIDFHVFQFQLFPGGPQAGLPDSFVTSLEQVENSSEICVICQDEVKTGRRLRCSHEFHEDCLRPWLRSKNTCPKCRTVCNN